MPPFLTRESELEAQLFLAAAEVFYKTRTWEACAPDRPLAFQVGGGPWRYATLMGHGGEEFGLAMFESWSGYRGFVDSDETTGDRLSVAGSFESVSLSPLGTVSALDAPAYLARGDVRVADDEVPVFVRYEPDGFAMPAYRPSVYAALMELLVERAGRVTTRVRRIDAAVETLHGTSRVRFPATGAESEEAPASTAGRG